MNHRNPLSMRFYRFVVIILYRHTNASILIGQGVDVQTVSKRLGHARTSTTTDIYSHALRRPDKEAAEKLDKLFNKNIHIETIKQV